MLNTRRFLKSILQTVLSGLLTALILTSLCGAAPAAPAVINVKVSEGGTVKISAENGSPKPDKESITLSGDEQGSFNIPYELPGTYRYRIFQEAGSAPGVKYDKTVYIADVFVEQKEDKSFASYITLSKEGSASKAEAVIFTNTKADSSLRGASKSDSTDRTENDTGGSGTRRTGTNDVRTGDSTPLLKWILMAILSFASAAVIAAFYIRRKNSSV